jgi:18S rRNA (guanine1575-N7)-methyltransferase
MSRPENVAPPELFYNAVEAGKYSGGSRVQAVQAAMAQRCLELLSLPAGVPALVLDVGCGSGLSGDVLAAAGHAWLGLDVAPAMLAAARERGSLPGGGGLGDALLADMGQGFGLRAGAFDGAVSVSALQWLFYAGRADHRAGRRLRAFFTSLYRCLRRGARAALQLYPENAEQLEIVTAAAAACGFGGGLVVDFPNSTKAKKYYLCLVAGGSGAAAALPRGLGDASRSSAASVASAAAAGDDDDVVRVYSRRAAAAAAAAGAGAGAPGAGDGGGAWPGAAAAAATFEARRERPKRKKRSAAARVSVKGRDWIIAKKAARRARGDETARDSKYTGRKRSGFRA